MYELRQLTDPVMVPDPINGDTHEAAEQDLMNLGLFRIDGDVFASVGAFEDRRGQYKNAADLPGVALSEGPLTQRHRQLPRAIKDRVMRSRVVRIREQGGSGPSGRPGPIPPDRALARAERLAAARDMVKNGEAEVRLVPVAEVTADDVVEQEEVVPMMFAGEPNR